LPGQIIIEGIAPYDGTYEFDFSYLTNREWYKVRQVADILPLDYWMALAKGDASLVVALISICFDRLDKGYDIEDFWNAEAGKIRLIPEKEEADASPPAQGPPENVESSSGNGMGSGEPGKPAGDSLPGSSLSATGGRGSEPSESAPARSET
jgi:hypothetical protein